MSGDDRPQAMTGGEALVQALKGHGVQVIFGYPGAHTVPLYEALRRDGGIRHVLVRHEQGAAFMADGYARSSGRVGVCVTTAGPGATNTATAIAEALSDCIPVVLLTAQIDTTARGKGAYHELDLHSFFKPITKWNAVAERPEDIPQLLADAFFECRTGRPGPVQLELPRDVLAAECRVAPAPPREVARPQAPMGEAQAVADELCRARRPAILAGGGVVAADACGELVALAEVLQAAVATTQMGRGAIPDSHALALGQSNTRRVSDAFARADLVLVVGCRLGQVSTRGWTLPLPNLVHIDIASAAFHPSYPPKRSIVADAKLALGSIAKMVRAAGRQPSLEWDVSALRMAGPSSAHKTPYDVVIECIEGAFGPDVILSLDVTMLTYRLMARRRAERPRSLLYPAAYIAMGYGLPGAIGAKLANPGRPIACIAGDGGFMMTVQELATAVRLDLALPILIYNDRCLQSIKQAHASAYEGHSFEVGLNNPDFVALAKAFGGNGRRVTDLSDLPSALAEAKASETVFVVEVVAGGAAG